MQKNSFSLSLCLILTALNPIWTLFRGWLNRTTGGGAAFGPIYMIFQAMHFSPLVLISGLITLIAVLILVRWLYETRGANILSRTMIALVVLSINVTCFYISAAPPNNTIDTTALDAAVGK
jgi:hypothetical protein